MITTVTETASTNADMMARASDGAPEGEWLRAERQSAGRGRMARNWASPVGNLYASTIIRLKPNDPPAPTLALVAAVALHRVVSQFVSATIKWPNDILVFNPSPSGEGQGVGSRRQAINRRTDLDRTPPTPTPPMKGRGLRKLSGILLERADNAIVAGFGVNLASYPDLDRPVTSIFAETGVAPDPAQFCEQLAASVADAIVVWRSNLGDIIVQWKAAAHPFGTQLSVDTGSGNRIEGQYRGLTPDGALRLALADGSERVIHAGDVFLV